MLTFMKKAREKWCDSRYSGKPHLTHSESHKGKVYNNDKMCVILKYCSQWFDNHKIEQRKDCLNTQWQHYASIWKQIHSLWGEMNERDVIVAI